MYHCLPYFATAPMAGFRRTSPRFRTPLPFVVPSCRRGEQAYRNAMRGVSSKQVIGRPGKAADMCWAAVFMPRSSLA